MSLKFDWPRHEISPHDNLATGTVFTISGPRPALFVLAAPMQNRRDRLALQLCSFDGAKPTVETRIISNSQLQGRLIEVTEPLVIRPGGPEMPASLKVDIRERLKNGDVVQTSALRTYLYIEGEDEVLLVDLETWTINRIQDVQNELSNLRCFRVWTIWREFDGKPFAFATFDGDAGLSAVDRMMSSAADH